MRRWIIGLVPTAALAGAAQERNEIFALLGRLKPDIVEKP